MLFFHHINPTCYYQLNSYISSRRNSSKPILQQPSLIPAKASPQRLAQNPASAPSIYSPSRSGLEPNSYLLLPKRCTPFIHSALTPASSPIPLPSPLLLLMEAVPIPEITNTLASAHGLAVAAIPYALSHLPMPKALSDGSRLLC